MPRCQWNKNIIYGIRLEIYSKTMKAIIFGANGQDGYYLSQILKREGVEVIAFGRKECDVGVQGYVCHQIAQHKPDYIFQLAATSTTSHDALWSNHKSIVDGSVNILDAVKRFCPKAKVWLAGSILQLTRVGSGTIFSMLPGNASAYAAQRNASVAYARYYRSIGIDAYVGYLSYHDSPRRGPNHLAKRIAMEAIEVGMGPKAYMTLRDPLDEKEFNYAGDMMEAVWAQVNSPHYEAVLGSGVAHTIWDYARACMKAVSPNDSKCRIKQEFTREGAVRQVTQDKRFQHHFKTSLSDLAALMVSSAGGIPAEQPAHIGSQP